MLHFTRSDKLFVIARAPFACNNLPFFRIVYLMLAAEVERLHKAGAHFRRESITGGEWQADPAVRSLCQLN
jgi:hypothetical protein